MKSLDAKVERFLLGMFNAPQGRWNAIFLLPVISAEKYGGDRYHRGNCQDPGFAEPQLQSPWRGMMFFFALLSRVAFIQTVLYLLPLSFTREMSFISYIVLFVFGPVIDGKCIQPICSRLCAEACISPLVDGERVQGTHSRICGNPSGQAEADLPRQSAPG